MTRAIVWSVLPIGLLVTLAVTVQIKASADRLAERDFVAGCSELQRMLTDRLDDHARILLSGAALFNASETVSREEWRLFTQGLKVEKQLPGIQGLGFSLLIPRSELSQHIQQIRKEGFPEYQVRPEGEREIYSSSIYLEPFSGRNVRAFGYDMFSEPVRRAAMERARDTDAAALSGKVVLVQETEQEVQAGTLMYVPVYSKGLPTATVEQRRAAIIGWVYSPCRMDDLLQGILGVNEAEQTPSRFLAIFDDANPSSQSLLFGHTPVGHGVRFKRQTPIMFNGHRWTLCFAQTGGGWFTASYVGVWLILIGGVLGTMLLCALLGALLYMQSDAQRLAKAMTSDLRESESNFRTFFESMTDMIMVVTPDGRILFTNSAVTRTLGYTADELKGMHLLDVHPADKRQEAESIFTAMFKGERESCPLPLLNMNGTLVPVETRVWFGKWNGEQCIFGVSKNLSVEQEAQQRFETLFRNNPSLIALTTLPDRRFTDVNEAFLSTLGYSREDVIGHTSTELGLFAYPKQRDMVAQQVNQLSRLSGAELQVRCKDGTILDGLFYGEVINSQGKQYFLSVMTDITARKRAEMELARLSVIQHDLMCLATDFVNVPLERQDAAIDQSLATMGQLIHADRAYLFAYDFDAGVMSNTHEWCGEGITPEINNLQSVPNAMLPDWVAAHQRGESIHIPSVAALPTDSYLRQVLDPQGIRSLITLPLMQGAVCLGFVGFDAVAEERDWREEEVALLRVLAELYAHFEARRATELETQALQQRLTLARDAAQAAALAKSLFLANMSHEIRTPLNAILGYVQIMERECQPCPIKPRLKAITRSGEHLLELLTDLLELVRCDAHTITLAPKAFDFYQALEDVRLMFVRHPATQVVALDFTYSPDMPRFIHADSGKVRQILVNLVGNAVKFTEKGSIRLSASVLDRGATDGALMIAVDVEDTGYGIGPDDLNRIFEVFEQAESGWKGGKGTGLGLYLSQRYAHALGGEITVTSQLGVGSCFRFTFRARAVSDEAQGQSSNRNVLRLSKAQRVLRLLVVDNDPSSRDMLASMLEPVGFIVETAASAMQALARMRQPEPVDLILMDKRIPSLATGTNGYVSKPVQREQLLSEIGRVCRIQYDYEQEQPGPHVVTPAGIDAKALARLPAAKRNLLEQALRRGDVQVLRKIVEMIAIQDAELAEGICVFVDGFDYVGLHRLLDSVKCVDTVS